MRGQGTPAEVTADAATVDTQQFIKRVRRTTRHRFSAEEKVRVVFERFLARGERERGTVCGGGALGEWLRYEPGQIALA